MSDCPIDYGVFKDLQVKLIGFFKFMVLENMSKNSNTTGFFLFPFRNASSSSLTGQC